MLELQLKQMYSKKQKKILNVVVKLFKRVRCILKSKWNYVNGKWKLNRKEQERYLGLSSYTYNVIFMMVVYNGSDSFSYHYVSFTFRPIWCHYVTLHQNVSHNLLSRGLLSWTEQLYYITTLYLWRLCFEYGHHKFPLTLSG